MLLVLSLSGFVAAAALVTAIAAPPAMAPAAGADTTATFEDLDGDGIDDDCETAVVADPAAAEAANAAVDLNKDGVISTSEAAQSDRTGGKNCNHGGYVSTVAHADEDGCETPDATETETETDNDTDAATADEAATEPTPDAPCVEPAEEVDPVVETDDPADETVVPAECVTPPADQAPEDTAPNAHGKAVSKVAHSDAIGGKNCNHGGAVSEAAKKDHAAKDVKKDAAKDAKKDKANKGKGK
jgi:hypothetical protein